MPQKGGAHTGMDRPKVECCLGGSPKGDRLLRTLPETVGADAANWGLPVCVTDDPRKSAPWEGVRSTTVSWNIWNETPVCVTCACEAASSPPLLAFGRKSGRFRNDLTWGPMTT